MATSPKLAWRWSKLCRLDCEMAGHNPAGSAVATMTMTTLLVTMTISMPSRSRSLRAECSRTKAIGAGLSHREECSDQLHPRIHHKG